MKTLRKISALPALCVMAAAVALSSCSQEEIAAPGTDGSEVLADGQEGALVVQLQLPDTRAAVGTLISETGPVTYDVSVDEGSVSTIRVVAFPTGADASSRSAINTPVLFPQAINASTTAAGRTIRIPGFAKGDYKVYLIANCNTPELAEVTTEAALKALILDYSSQLPVPGKFVMVHESSVTVDKQINYLGSGSTDAEKEKVYLKINAVKVNFNVIFDKSHAETAAAYGANGLKITKMTVCNVSSTASLIESAALTDAATRTLDVTGKHYATFTKTPANADKNNLDVISGRSGEFTPSDPAAKWVYSATLYLPERMVSSSAKQAYVDLDGQLFGVTGTEGPSDAKNHFRVELGHLASSIRQLPRGSYYEVIATVKTLGDIEITSYLKLADWGTPVQLYGQITNGYLRVSDTSVSVTALKPGVLTYETNFPDGSQSAICEEPLIGTTPVVLGTMSAGTLTLKINPAIDITTITDPTLLTGTAKVRVQAGNIYKYIDVNYDISPFFTVDAVTFRMMWGDVTEVKANVVTNLGGVTFKNEAGSSTLTPTFTLQTGDAKVNVSYAAGAENGNYVITMKLPSAPSATTQLFYNIGPSASGYYDTFKQLMTVTVSPAPGKYRIYMRAINNESQTNSFTAIKTEDTDLSAGQNWNDGWLSGHKLYMYYQYGESGGTGEIPETNVWYFTGSYPGVDMTKDTQNPGWYYYDAASTLQGTNNHGKDPRGIVPGETLVLFNASENASANFLRQRFSHHMDPGIPLFDYEDREGWYLYDPLSSPYYRIYDEKPVVEDVTYTIYYNAPLYGWCIRYGVANNSLETYLMEDNLTAAGTVTVSGTTYYKYTLRFKAPKGQYDKGVRLKTYSISNPNQDAVNAMPMMFGGRNWKTGYWNGSQWVSGAPN